MAIRSSFNRTAVLCVAVALLLAATLVLSNLVTGASAAVKPVIVQLKGDPVVVAKAAAEAAGRGFDEVAYRQQLINRQEEFLNQLSAAGVQFSVASVDAPNGLNGERARIAFRFNYVYNGVTLNVPEAAIPAIEAMSQVESVHPDREIELHLDNSVKYTRAPSLYGKPAQIKMGDALQTGGYEGQGINIAIIDTGVEWQHPMFGSDPTPPQFGVGPALANSNRKVIYYMNFTAGAVTDDFGHGTHVSGITAGYLSQAPGPDGLPLTADDVQIHGVAPQAKIMGYKVLSTVGSGVSSSIVMAIEDAVQPFTLTGVAKPVAHVINMSLGNTANDPNYPTSIASDNATLAGVTVVASAGNSGRPTPTNPTGEGTIGSPGSGRRVLTVGANNDPGKPAEDIVMDRVYDNGRAPERTAVLDPAAINRNTTGLVDGDNKAVAAGQRTDIPLVMGGGSPAIGNPVAQYYVYAGTVASPADVPDSVAGRIAIARPSGAFAVVANSIVAKGAAAAILIYEGKITIVNSTVPVWSISEGDARYLLDLLSSNDTVGVDPAKGVLSEYPVRISQGAFSPAMADFSSKGTVTGFGQVKPDVTAPGVAILSATVRAGGVSPAPSFMFHPTGYISASGTSMSSPMTAGVVALVKQKNPTWTPSMIRAAIMNTATNLRRADGTPVPDGTQTLNQQGAGLVDAFAAANASALMGVGVIDQGEGSTSPRPNQICPNYGGNPSPLCGSSPGNPDFLGSHSFGAVPVAAVIGTATKSQTVTISDIRDGAGAGLYRLSSSAVRNLPEGVSVSFTNAAGEPVSEVEVPAGGSASFRVNVSVNGESVPADPTQIEWYVTAARADGGQTLRMPFQFRAVRPSISAVAPTLGDVAGNEFGGNPSTDIDGNYRLSYSYAGNPAPAKFRVQESKDNGATWTTLADVPAAQSAFDVVGRTNGTYLYRVTGLFAVQYGLIDGPASAAKAVTVDRRVESDVSSLIQAAIVDNTVSMGGGVFQFDQTLRNVSDTSVFAPLRFTITSVSSRSGRVRVQNADNSGDGVALPAVFDYTSQAGSDQRLGANESSAARRLQFANPASEMFEFTAQVRGHLPDAANASGASSGGAGGGDSTASGTTGGGGGTTSGGNTVSGLTQTVTGLRFVVNPLTKSVSVQLIK